MRYRCQYRLSDMLVLGAAAFVGDGYFDDAAHGTTIEFMGDMLPVRNEYTYDDTPSSEQLVPTPDFDAYLDVTTTEDDTDGDGVPDVLADDAATGTIEIQKKDKDGNSLTAASHTDTYFVEANCKMDRSSGNLVNGAAIVTLQPSADQGKLAHVLIRSSTPGLREGSVQIKFI